ncbi:MAG: thioredoxin family protein [Gemmatimonadaceae bacterium]
MRRITALSVIALYASLSAFVATDALAQVKPKAPITHVEAHVQLRDAVAKAHAANKGVLVKFSASWCGPCHAFDRFLYDTTGVGAIMQKHFVIVGLTVLEMPPMDSLNTKGGLQLAKEMGGELEGSTGIPYFFMVDGNGKRLGDSNSMPDSSNTGHPEAAIEVQSFDKLLVRTAPRMTEDERARIKTFLDRMAGRR